MTTYTDTDIAELAAPITGDTPEDLYDIIETYITQMEDIDGKAIDRDEISADDAAFLIEAIKQATSSTPEPAIMDEITDLARQIEEHHADIETLSSQRDQLIMRAHTMGQTRADIARAARISRQRVSKIIEARSS